MAFNFFKNTLQKIYSSVSNSLQSLFAQPINEQSLKELETILLKADTGIKTTTFILDSIKKAWAHGSLNEGHELKTLLEEKLRLLLETQLYHEQSTLYLLVGINGSGKTTTAAKLMYLNKQKNKKVLCIAADTFRAAAVQQLEQWAQHLQVDIVVGQEGKDPAAVVFAGIQKFKQEHYEVLIIDTAGRLQTKNHLMKELEKIKRVIQAQLPEKAIATLLTIDAMLGQNSFEQAKLFHESTSVSGVILTKMDATAKGGIVFSIINELKIPIAYISYGEQPQDFKLFKADEYVSSLLEE